jgi:hypothetical protein
MSFVFKIFGAPHIFDLYEGNENEENYFQRFYNKNNENTKFTIHHTASDKISYSYLRYNFLSGSNRKNSFFGMSVIFDGEYCKDVVNLYKLFEDVYHQIILKNKILLEEIKGKTGIQAKYLITTFAEAEDEVKCIENIISKNLRKNFADDIIPIDFSPGRSDLTVKLNDKKKISVFLTAQRKYSWVSISPEYKGEVINLSLEELAKLSKVIKNVSDTYRDVIAPKLAEYQNIQSYVTTLSKQIDDAKKLCIPTCRFNLPI